MSKDGGPAFPCVDGTQDSMTGMSLRDWFAGVALQGLCAEENYMAGMDKPDKYNQISLRAFAYADAMLAEREK